MTRYEAVEDSMTAKGKKEMLAHLDGKKLTLKQAILAKCYDCMGYFNDGKVDCEVKGCSLHPFMPYNPNKAKSSRVVSDEQKKAFVERTRKPVICSNDNKTQSNNETKAKRHRKVA